MGVGRWLRNKGFVFTADQKFDRWEDIGGPRRFEKWTLQGPFEFIVGRLVNALAAVAAALGTAWLIAWRGAWDASPAGAVAVGMLIGTALIVPAAGYRLWRRDRDLYDAWLNKQRRRQAEAQRAPTGPGSPH